MTGMLQKKQFVATPNKSRKTNQVLAIPTFKTCIIEIKLGKFLCVNTNNSYHR